MVNSAPVPEFRTPLQDKWITFITLVTYHSGQGRKQLEDYLRDKLKGFQDKVIIHLVATTWGRADTVIVWQAVDMDAAKKFRDNPGSKGIGDFSSMVSAHTDIW